ncbi:MAG TPA: chemotaxis protein CheW [Phycisphaerae bacterium]|nr:chemotaxis protein CheW [Phycisphaerae bacterium]HOJ73092.1 chemotaxis protein CheW [Phycisphaerae bacterium]HOM52708.1 chemotaxis protein CheW [Phycisphaerae bacterium]HON68361.1 chemotaxis protein CheW [Phycisphaerae bacterium]HOQ87128.1 chemotaxis protein CheW [Phycisphaerae bacterium]
MTTAVLEQPTSTGELNESTRDLGGKYLTFMLDDEEYGIEILKVREIIGIMDITKVPQTPDFVEGVINLRGKVIPVIDLRTKFGLARTEYNDQTCIIVVDVGMMMGIIVDTVQEVHDIPSANIEPPPKLGSAVDTSFILGMGKVKDDVKILLDIDKVLTSEDLVALRHFGEE